MITKHEKLAQLRTRAEAVLKQAVDAPPKTVQSIEEVAHELNVYHVELEIQLEDLQQSFRALEIAQERYTNLFDFAPVGYIVTDKLGVIQKANLTVSSMLSVRREDMEKANFAEFITVPSRDIYHLCRRAVMSSRQSHACEVQILRSDGSIFHAQLTIDLPDHASETLRTAVTNITTIKQAEESLRRALTHEQEVNDIRLRVLNVIAHEFRTPLTIMLASVDALERYGDRMTPEQKQHRYQTMRNFVWHMNDTVHDARSVGSDSEPMSFSPTTFKLLEYLRQLTRDVEVLEDSEKRVVLTMNSANETEMVTWDQHLLRRIVINLLHNALNYSKAAVDFKVSFEGDSVLLKFIDHGIGIAEADQQHMYDLFFRGHNAEFIPGMGIGMYIVKRAVNAHAGSISCESHLEQGTEFTVVLPRHASAQIA
ncbi:MAG: PAS domain-containing sensor histidine kinase [Pleurocapsa minor GSE-CHR-MK-17-07R]|jgi:PAS domain S-box-containing protein|nr:PAS domain-containing sensor histidine kinase [Pleurocapsa minor GSE-CHR-MK 17-07R]